MAVSIGLDIGTTTISAVAVDAENGRVVRSDTVANDSFLQTDAVYERIQDPRVILDKAIGLLTAYTSLFEEVDAIGITGQMHGILYLDKNNSPVSPLMIWQDERGNLVYKNGEMKVPNNNLLKVYSMESNEYDYSNIIESIKDYGDDFNITKKLKTKK